ncbi:MAG: uroporphyrinogen-III C-methyltransferase [Candidatus Sulfotelmatobacter sp.]
MRGTVYLVGAGPGDPELLTVKATRLLQTAEAVLYDDLVAPEILQLAPPTVRLHNVGKRCGKKKIRQEEINFLMIALATAGLRVIRLKSGDPMMFGRAGEEIEALRQAEVPYEIVPGVTSALAAAAAAAIPLTHRRISSAVIFLTAHQASESEAAEWNRFAGSGSTLVIYMPGRDYGELSRRLRSAGLDEETPCAILSRVCTARQQMYRTTIADLPNALSVESPSLLVVGGVVGLSDFESPDTDSPASEWARKLLPSLPDVSGGADRKIEE